MVFIVLTQLEAEQFAGHFLDNFILRAKDVHHEPRIRIFVAVIFFYNGHLGFFFFFFDFLIVVLLIVIIVPTADRPLRLGELILPRIGFVIA